MPLQMCVRAFSIPVPVSYRLDACQESVRVFCFNSSRAELRDLSRDSFFVFKGCDGCDTDLFARKSSGLYE